MGDFIGACITRFSETPPAEAKGVARYETASNTRFRLGPQSLGLVATASPIRPSG